MSLSIDRMFDELPNRGSWFEVMTVVLDNTKGLPLIVRSRTWRTITCTDVLAVSTVVPGWAVGWHTIIRDEPAREILTWYLHYARQYVHRSYVAKVLMIAWERDGRILHPFGSQGAKQYYGPALPAPSLMKMLDIATENAHKQWGEAKCPLQVRSVWNRVNTLDPNLHQSIFHFARGQSLLAGGFEMEAVIAFDCVIQSLKALLIRGKLATSATSRGDICLLLKLGLRAAEVADKGYFLRNNFGAHPGGWRWWDQHELTQELAPALGLIAERALRKAAALELTIRAIDPTPTNWPDWLLENFSVIWEAVWFDRLHGL